MAEAVSDIWSREPAWVGYATLADGNSDKFYEVRVDQNNDSIWCVTKRYGRNPDTKGGQSITMTDTSRQSAIGTAQGVLNSKVFKGYEQRDWPHGSAAMPDFHDPEAVEAWLEA